MGYLCHKHKAMDASASSGQDLGKAVTDSSPLMPKGTCKEAPLILKEGVLEALGTFSPAHCQGSCFYRSCRNVLWCLISAVELRMFHRVHMTLLQRKGSVTCNRAFKLQISCLARMATTPGLRRTEHGRDRAGLGRRDRGGRKYVEIKDKGRALHLRGGKISISKSDQGEKNVFKMALKVLLV